MNDLTATKTAAADLAAAISRHKLATERATEWNTKVATAQTEVDEATGELSKLLGLPKASTAKQPGQLAQVSKWDTPARRKSIRNFLIAQPTKVSSRVIAAHLNVRLTSNFSSLLAKMASEGEIKRHSARGGTRYTYN